MQSTTLDITLSERQVALQKKMLGPQFKLFTAFKVPLGFIAGMKLTRFEPGLVQTTLPFKFLNINPFQSTYFAAQSMAAELSTAAPCLLAIEGIKPSVAFIIVDMEAKFSKKATTKLTFTCDEGMKAFEAVKRCMETGNAETVKMKTVGKMTDGTVASEFYFTWSFKQRKG